jgi:hypothetical protein
VANAIAHSVPLLGRELDVRCARDVVRDDGGRIRRDANGTPNATRERPESLDWPNPDVQSGNS